MLINIIRLQIINLIFHCILILFTQDFAQAGTVILKSVVTVNKEKQEIEIIIQISNQGDDIASNVHPIAYIEDETFQFEPSDVAHGGMEIFKVKKQSDILPSLKLGTYPVRILISYMDSSSTLHEIPSVGVLRTANIPINMSIDAQMKSVTIKNNKEIIEVLVENLASEYSRVELELFTSSYISINPESHELLLGPNQQQTVPFKITSKVPTSYKVMPLLLFLKQYDETSHQTKLIESSITVTQASSAAPVSVAEQVNYSINMILVAGGIIIAAVVITLIVLLLRKGHTNSANT
jgi:hypothetical protein